MFIRHRHRSNYAIRFVSGHVFRRVRYSRKENGGFSPCVWQFHSAAPIPRISLLDGARSSSPRPLRKNAICYSPIVQRNCLSMSCINIAHNTNICCTISWSCQTTFICSLLLDTKSALNVQFNSLKADSHSAREGNSGSRHPFGNVVFQMYGFMARKLSHAFGNISLRIQSNDDWFRGQRNTPILHPTPDSNLTRYRRG